MESIVVTDDISKKDKSNDVNDEQPENIKFILFTN